MSLEPRHALKDHERDNVIGVFSEAYIRVFARPVFKTFNRALVRYGMKGLGVQNFGSDFASGETLYFKKISPELDHPGNAVLDIGAHNGAFTAAVLACTEHLTIHAVEAHPGSFERLCSRYGDHPRVVLHNVAAGATLSDAQIYDEPEGTGSPRATCWRTYSPQIVSKRMTFM